MQFLIWSNQYGMWWRANHSGYTQYIEEAGRYGRAEALAIVRRASLDGQLATQQQDPVTRWTYLRIPEVMVSAPEEIPGVEQWAVTS